MNIKVKSSIKSYFKMSLKQENGTPSIKEVKYTGADGQQHTGLQFEGYANTKDLDRGMEIVEPKAFEKTLATFMKNPQIFLQHDENKPIGTITTASITDKGLYIIGIVKIDTDNIFQKLRTGVIKTMSIGYSVEEFERRTVKTEEGQDVEAFVITKLNLYEVSLVSVPMNHQSEIKSSKDLPKGLSDEEYKTYFETDKKDTYPLYKSFYQAIQTKELQNTDSLLNKLKVLVEAYYGITQETLNAYVYIVEIFMGEENTVVYNYTKYNDDGMYEDKYCRLGFVVNEDNEYELVGEPIQVEPETTRVDAMKNFIAYTGKGLKSASCRLSNETREQCVSRKTEELIMEGYEQNQAVAVANSMCDVDCSGNQEDAETENNEKENIEEKTTEEEAKAEAGELSVGDFVEWNSSGGMARGQIVDIKTEAGEGFTPDNSDQLITAKEDDPVALIEVYREEENENGEMIMVATGDKVVHLFSTLTKIDKPSEESGYNKPEEEDKKEMTKEKISDAGDMAQNTPETMEKQNKSLEIQVKELQDKTQSLELENKQLSDLLGDAETVIDGLQKQLDNYTTLIQEKNSLIEKARQTWEKKGKVFLYREEQKSDLYNQIEALKKNQGF